MRKPLFIFIVVLTVLFFLALRPVSSPRSFNTRSVFGIVDNVTADKTSKDIYIDLKSDNDIYYVNRGLESGIPTEKFERLEREKVKLVCIRHWTPLDPFSTTHHICQVEVNGEIIYDEFKH